MTPSHPLPSEPGLRSKPMLLVIFVLSVQMVGCVLLALSGRLDVAIVAGICWLMLDALIWTA